MSYLRGGLVGQLLAGRRRARSSPRSTTCSPGRTYDAQGGRRSCERRRRAAARTSVGRVVEVESPALRQGSCTAVGESLAAGSRARPPTPADAVAAGRRRSSSPGSTEHDVEIDPRFGLGSSHGQTGSPTPTARSYAVSDARQAAAPPTSPTPSYAAGPAGRPALRLSRADAGPRRRAAAGVPAGDAAAAAPSAPGSAAQTHRSLARYLLEETHETLEAIDAGERPATRPPARGARRPAAAGLLPRRDRRGGRRASPSTTSPRGIAEKMRAPQPARLRRRPADDAGRATRPRSTTPGRRSRPRRSSAPRVPTGSRRRCPPCCYADKVLDRLARPAVAPDRALGADGGDPDLGDRLLALVAEARAAGVDPEQALRDAVRRLAVRRCGPTAPRAAGQARARGDPPRCARAVG